MFNEDNGSPLKYLNLKFINDLIPFSITLEIPTYLTTYLLPNFFGIFSKNVNSSFCSVGISQKHV